MLNSGGLAQGIHGTIWIPLISVIVRRLRTSAKLSALSTNAEIWGSAFSVQHRTIDSFTHHRCSSVQFSSVHSLSRVRLFATPWIAALQASLSITDARSSLRLTSIESVMPSRHLILGRPLLLLPSIPPSMKVFSSESTLHMRWPKYWSFSFSIIPSKEIPGLISFRMDWLDLCSPRDSQESSPTPQFKRINSLVLSLLHSPTLTSIPDHWKNHSLD